MDDFEAWLDNGIKNSSSANVPNSYKDQYWQDKSNNKTAEKGLPVGLLNAVVQHGERSNNNQTNSLGTYSPYQVTKSTRDLYLKNKGIDAFASPENAVEVASQVLADGVAFAKQRTNDPDEINRLAAGYYHAGGNQKNWGSKTQAYMDRVARGIAQGTIKENVQVPKDDFEAFLDNGITTAKTNTKNQDKNDRLQATNDDLRIQDREIIKSLGQDPDLVMKSKNYEAGQFIKEQARPESKYGLLDVEKSKLDKKYNLGLFKRLTHDEEVKAINDSSIVKGVTNTAVGALNYLLSGFGNKEDAEHARAETSLRQKRYDTTLDYRKSNVPVISQVSKLLGGDGRVDTGELLGGVAAPENIVGFGGKAVKQVVPKSLIGQAGQFVGNTVKSAGKLGALGVANYAVSADPFVGTSLSGQGRTVADNLQDNSLKAGAGTALVGGAFNAGANAIGAGARAVNAKLGRNINPTIARNKALFEAQGLTPDQYSLAELMTGTDRANFYSGIDATANKTDLSARARANHQSEALTNRAREIAGNIANETNNIKFDDIDNIAQLALTNKHARRIIDNVEDLNDLIVKAKEGNTSIGNEAVAQKTQQIALQIDKFKQITKSNELYKKADDLLPETNDNINVENSLSYIKKLQEQFHKEDAPFKYLEDIRKRLELPEDKNILKIIEAKEELEALKQQYKYELPEAKSSIEGNNEAIEAFNRAIKTIEKKEISPLSDNVFDDVKSIVNNAEEPNVIAANLQGYIRENLNTLKAEEVSYLTKHADDYISYGESLGKQSSAKEDFLRAIRPQEEKIKERIGLEKNSIQEKYNSIETKEPSLSDYFDDEISKRNAQSAVSEPIQSRASDLVKTNEKQIKSRISNRVYKAIDDILLKNKDLDARHNAIINFININKNRLSGDEFKALNKYADEYLDVIAKKKEQFNSVYKLKEELDSLDNRKERLKQNDINLVKEKYDNYEAKENALALIIDKKEELNSLKSMNNFVASADEVRKSIGLPDIDNKIKSKTEQLAKNTDKTTIKLEARLEKTSSIIKSLRDNKAILQGKIKDLDDSFTREPADVINTKKGRQYSNLREQLNEVEGKIEYFIESKGKLEKTLREINSNKDITTDIDAVKSINEQKIKINELTKEKINQDATIDKIMGDSFFNAIGKAKNLDEAYEMSRQFFRDTDPNLEAGNNYFAKVSDKLKGLKERKDFLEKELDRLKNETQNNDFKKNLEIQKEIDEINEKYKSFTVNKSKISKLYEKVNENIELPKFEAIRNIEDNIKLSQENKLLDALNSNQYNTLKSIIEGGDVISVHYKLREWLNKNKNKVPLETARYIASLADKKLSISEKMKGLNNSFETRTGEQIKQDLLNKELSSVDEKFKDYKEPVQRVGSIYNKASTTPEKPILLTNKAEINEIIQPKNKQQITEDNIGVEALTKAQYDTLKAVLNSATSTTQLHNYLRRFLERNQSQLQQDALKFVARLSERARTTESKIKSNTEFLADNANEFLSPADKARHTLKDVTNISRKLRDDAYAIEHNQPNKFGSRSSYLTKSSDAIKDDIASYFVKIGTPEAIQARAEADKFYSKNIPELKQNNYNEALESNLPSDIRNITRTDDQVQQARVAGRLGEKGQSAYMSEFIGEAVEKATEAGTDKSKSVKPRLNKSVLIKEIKRNQAMLNNFSNKELDGFIEVLSILNEHKVPNPDLTQSVWDAPNIYAKEVLNFVINKPWARKYLSTIPSATSDKTKLLAGQFIAKMNIELMREQRQEEQQYNNIPPEFLGVGQ